MWREKKEELVQNRGYRWTPREKNVRIVADEHVVWDGKAECLVSITWSQKSDVKEINSAERKLLVEIILKPIISKNEYKNDS